jgi:GNAT superfamily N-acetyltransferase
MTHPDASKDRADNARFLRFVIKSTFLHAHRNTVVVLPAPEHGSEEKEEEEDAQKTMTSKKRSGGVDGKKKEKIVAATLWLAPRARLGGWRADKLIRAGVLSPLLAWRWKGLARLTREFEPASARAAQDAFAARGAGKADRAWFLQLAWTDPAHQGRGYLSMLVRAQVAAAGPRAVLALDASGKQARDRYEHLGFEVRRLSVSPLWFRTVMDDRRCGPLQENCVMRFGVGKVDEDGVAAEGQAATGFVNYSMTRVRGSAALQAWCVAELRMSPGLVADEILDVKDGHFGHLTPFRGPVARMRMIVRYSVAIGQDSGRMSSFRIAMAKPNTVAFIS